MKLNLATIIEEKNKIKFINISYFDSSEEMPYDYYSKIEKRKETPHSFPIPIIPLRFDGRIRNQLSCFTFYGKYDLPVEKMGEENKIYYGKLK